MSGRFSILWLFLIVFHFISPRAAEANPARALQSLAKSELVFEWVFGSGAGRATALGRTWAEAKFGTADVTAPRLVEIGWHEAEGITAQILGARATHQIFAELGKTAPDDLLAAFFRSAGAIEGGEAFFSSLSPRHLFRRLGGSTADGQTVGSGLPDGSARLIQRPRDTSMEIRVRVGEVDYPIEPGAIPLKESGNLIAFSEGDQIISLGNRFVVGLDGRAVYHNTGRSIQVLQRPHPGHLDAQAPIDALPPPLRLNKEPLVKVPEGSEITSFAVATTPEGHQIVAVVNESGSQYLRGWVSSGREEAVIHGSLRLGPESLTVTETPIVLGARFSPLKSQGDWPIVTLDTVDSASFGTHRFVLDGRFSDAAEIGAGF